jgi:hypothetical protein
MPTDRETLDKLDVSREKMVSSMRRNLLAELVIVLVSVMAIAIFYFIAFNGMLREVSWMYIILAAVFIVYYYKKNKLLKDMECSMCRVKSNLEHQLKMLRKYIRLYLVLGTLLVPLVLLFFYVLMYYKHIIILPGLRERIGSDDFALLYIIFAVTFTAALYFLNRWYVYRLYGRYIERLEHMLSEMDALA